MKFDGPANTLLKADGRPPFIYGTAWKKGETGRLVKEAVTAGFTALDTAAQPRHYKEELFGGALRELYSAGTTSRNDLYIQTKFTSPRGQDLNDLPYDPTSPLEQQIHTSIASSLHNLRPIEEQSSVENAYIDTLVLHSPLDALQDTLAAWKVFETYVPHKIRRLGISNTDMGVLRAVYEVATVKPSVVQNRFYPQTAYDTEIRAFCNEKGIVYESFWTLTGNPRLLKDGVVHQLSQATGVAPAVALYALVMELGIAPLNGTTNINHMKQDLEDVVKIRNWSFVYGSKWVDFVSSFKATIGDAT